MKFGGGNDGVSKSSIEGYYSFPGMGGNTASPSMTSPAFQSNFTFDYVQGDFMFCVGNYDYGWRDQWLRIGLCSIDPRTFGFYVSARGALSDDGVAGFRPIVMLKDGVSFENVDGTFRLIK